MFDSTIPALFLPRRPEAGMLIRLPDEEVRHVRALRLREGDQVLLLDGAGARASATIVRLEKREILLRAETINFDEAEGRPYIALCFGVPADKSRLEWCVEKAVELGTRELIPIVSERTEGFFHRERIDRVAVAALKQSQGSYLPRIQAPVPFGQALDRVSEFDRTYLCHEGASPDDSLARALLSSGAPGRSLLVIGPEGGFSAREVELAAARSARVVSLGPTRLRAETAAIVALTLAFQLGSHAPGMDNR